MCKDCCPNSFDNVIHYDENNIPYYLHETMEWDDYNDGFVYDKIYINYCPWCGRALIKGE